MSLRVASPSPVGALFAPRASVMRASERPPRRERAVRRFVRMLAVLLTLAGLALALAPTQPDAGTYLAAAARDRATQRYDLALQQYAAAHSAAPADPRPLCFAAELRVLRAEWLAAIASYRDCLARDGANGAAWLALGDALQQAGDAPGAAHSWQTAADRGVRDGWRRLAVMYETAGQATDAERVWARLPSSDIQARAHLGMLALLRGDLPTAQTDFLVVRAGGGDELIHLGDTGFLDLAGLSPDLPGWLGRLGYAFLGAGLPRLALEPLRHATTAEPEIAPAHAYLGWALWLTGSRDQGAVEVATARRLDDQLSFAWFASGEIAAVAGDLADADTDLRQGLSLDAGNSALWLAEARVLLAQRDYFQADLAFERASILSTDPAPTIEWLQFYVDHRYGLGNQRALPAALASAQRWPANEPIRFRLAQLYDLANQPAFAFYAAAQARALDPTDPGPHVLLGHYALLSGDLVAAAIELRTALALQPNGPFVPQAEALLAPIAAIEA